MTNLKIFGKIDISLAVLLCLLGEGSDLAFGLMFLVMGIVSTVIGIWYDGREQD